MIEVGVDSIVIINPEGYMGLGIDPTTYKLDVVGAVCADSGFTAGGYLAATLSNNTLTISKPGMLYVVDTEGAVALDSIETIVFSSAFVGDRFYITTKDEARDIAVTSNIGNIMSLSGDISMTQPYLIVEFMKTLYEKEWTATRW